MKYGELQFAVPAIRILENEHRYLAYLMGEWHAIVLRFEREVMNLEECRSQLKQLRAQILDFTDPLKRHTQKEETYFFPLLGTYIGFEQGPLVGIQEEHKEIEAYIGHFLHHTGHDIDQLTLPEIQAAVKDAGEAFEVLTVHLIKEETVLFPMTEKLFSSAHQDRLYENLNTLIT